MKDKVLKFSGFLIKGISDLTCWGGGNACIEMSPFKVNHLREIKNNINDNGFGVQQINGAICDIYKNYNGYIEYYKTIEINKVSEDTKEYYLQLQY